MAETRFGVQVDDADQVLDLVLHHPKFPLLTETHKAMFGYLVLDWVMGEDGVERWVRLVERFDEAPSGSVPPDALREILSGLKARHPDPTWTILEGTEPDGSRAMVVARRPLKPVEHPLFDLHGELGLHFVERTDEGLPDRPALDRLRAFEDELLSVFGDEVLLAAHHTAAGTRTFHLYCDRQGSVPPAVDRFVAARWPGARNTWSLDPAWEAIAPFR